MIEPIWTMVWNSPIGCLRLVANDRALIAIQFIGDETRQARSLRSFSAGEDSLVLRITQAQLEEYFSGRRRRFTVPLHLRGSAFQMRVWQALQEIPYGQVISYRQLAQRIAQPQAVRAVGQANRKNPVPIIVPCHRVINHNGKPGGYAGGLLIKQKLLALEGIHL